MSNFSALKILKINSKKVPMSNYMSNFSALKKIQLILGVFQHLKMKTLYGVLRFIIFKDTVSIQFPL